MFFGVFLMEFALKNKNKLSHFRYHFLVKDNREDNGIVLLHLKCYSHEFGSGNLDYLRKME